MFFNFSYKRDNLSYIFNNLEKYYRELDTICFDISNTYNSYSDNLADQICSVNKLFDKIGSTNTKNVYINSFILQGLKVNLFNTQNICIFGKKSYILSNFNSYNNIFVNSTLIREDNSNDWIKKENCNHSYYIYDTYHELYIKYNEYYTLYKHISIDYN